MRISSADVCASFFLLPLLFHLARGDIVRYDNGYDATFSVINVGRVETVIMWREDLDLRQCAYTCIQHLQCESINYHEALRSCELTDREFEEGWIDETDADWTNYATPRAGEFKF